jgi:uncharacterized delta-60 repeat protein
VELAQVETRLTTTDQGKLIAFGNASWSVDPTEPLSVMRLLHDGSPDPEYADGGQYIGPELFAGHVEVDDLGRVVFSAFDGPNGSDGVLSRLLQDGAFDYSFGVQSISGLGGPFILARDGVLVPQGSTITLLGPDGAPDPTFGSGGVVDLASMGSFSEAGVQPDGKIVLLGAQDQGETWVLVRLDASGNLDLSFGAGGIIAVDPSVYDMTVDVEGGILLSGSAKPIEDGELVLQRFTADGHVDQSFGERGLQTVRGLQSGSAQVEVLPNGRILLINRDVTRLLPNGALDPSFGEYGALSGFNDDGFALGGAVDPDGRIYLIFGIPDASDESIVSTRLFCIKPDGHD